MLDAPQRQLNMFSLSAITFNILLYYLAKGDNIYYYLGIRKYLKARGTVWS